MITICTKKLIEVLWEADECEEAIVNKGTLYLLDCFITPLKAQKPIILAELDFDAFSVEDIQCLLRMDEEEEAEMMKVRSFCKEISVLPPRATNPFFV